MNLRRHSHKWPRHVQQPRAPRNKALQLALTPMRSPAPGQERAARFDRDRFDPRVAVECLLRARNPDGGWPYASAQSWTEPTALAILALRTTSVRSDQQVVEACCRGIDWLVAVQRDDGGFAPAPAVRESTWVTSLAALALASGDAGQRSAYVARWSRATAWLVTQKPAETSGVIGVLQRLLNTPGSHPPPGGASWFPGTAAWVAPTAMRVFALARAAALTGDPSAHHAVERARNFLLTRRLADGGWNHGGWYGASEPVTSYPETTGIALLALRGLPPHALQPSIDLAEANIARPGSLEAWAWLNMSLIVHGRRASHERADTPLESRAWTVRDLALGILSSNASSSDNPFTARPA